MSLALSPFLGPSMASAGSQPHPPPLLPEEEGLCSSSSDWKWQDQRPDTEALFLGGRMASSVWWELEAGATEGPRQAFPKWQPHP